MIHSVGAFYGLLFIGFVLIVTIGIVHHNRKMNDHIDIRNIPHLNGVLVRVQSERSSAFGKLKDGRKIFLFDSDNYSYMPYALNKFLEVGDSIVKNEKSDTLYIYRNQSLYYFLLGESIEK
jgi:hypothetical protein